MWIIRGFLLILALGCLVLAPQAQAVCQQGCLTNENTALGEDALLSPTGFDNTAIGFEALESNTTGNFNTANGATALGANTSGIYNTATGFAALLNNTTGGTNTAIGFDALFSNTTGSDNTATGNGALLSNTTGNFNTAIGASALLTNTTGNNNIALGYLAGQYLGGDNNIDIGNQGGADDSGTIRIGTPRIHHATYIAGISRTPLTNGGAVEVGITGDGQLGVRPSSVRFKEAIKPMDKASEAILALKPVTFRYKNDSAALPQFGLVAEEVAKVNPDLVARDKEGKPFTVRYDEINAMLLNEFLKEHRKVEQLEKQVAALTTGLQKVSAQLELSKAAPQMVLSNQ